MVLGFALANLVGVERLRAQTQETAPSSGIQPGAEPISWAWGSERAIIEVVEFTDFACTFCAQFHTESYESLFAEYVATGKVRWVFVPFASGRFRGSEEALAFVVCAAEQGKDVASLRRMVFDRQGAWSGPNGSGAFKRFAEELNLAPETYDQCARSDETAGRIRENGRRAMEAGVRGTPQLFVDGFPLMGALPTEVYRRLFDEAIGPA